MSVSVLNASAVGDLTSKFDPALIAKGAVFVIGFDAIRDRSGTRWTMRQDTVREYVERQFQKYFTPADQLVRLDDVHFMVVQPLESGFGAHSRALKLLSEGLKFFLGSGATSDIRLSQVTRIGPDGVELAPIEVSDADLARLASLDWDSGALPTSDHTAEGAQPPPAGPIMSRINAEKARGNAALKGDRTYEVMVLVEPIWSINQRAVVSYQLRPLFFELQESAFVNANLANATPGDLMRLDLLVLTEAQRLFREQGQNKRFALHVPIHHVSLTMSGARQTVLTMLQRFLPAASSSIVVVLVGLESGTPHSRIVELTSALANRCRAVVAMAPGLDFKMDRWRDARLSGVAVDLSILANSNERLNIKQMSDFAARLPGVAPALLAYSVSNTAVLLASWSAGFTHVGGEVIAKYSEGVLQPLRLDPIDIYQAKS
jgi:hypothetical protein